MKKMLCATCVMRYMNFQNLGLATPPLKLKSILICKIFTIPTRAALIVEFFLNAVDCRIYDCKEPYICRFSLDNRRFFQNCFFDIKS